MVHTIAIICSEYLFVLPVLVGIVYFILESWETRKRMIVLSVVALPLTIVAMFILNSLYDNPRPDVVRDFEPLFQHWFAGNGFPSSHATMTALIACVMYVFNRRIGLFLFFISILVSLARVYFGLHHFIDIVGGIFLAIIITIISQTILKKLNFSQSQK